MRSRRTASRSRGRAATDRTDLDAVRGQTTSHDLERSLRATTQGLTAFLESLRDAGLEEAADDYRQLASVLINQRLWAANNNAADLYRHFAAISALAGSIRDILSPYVSLMGRLEDLLAAEGVAASIDGGVNEPHERLPLAESILEALVRLGPCSPRRLSRELDKRIPEVKGQLHSLVEAGVVLRRGWGAGQSYRLSEESRLRALAALAEGVVA